MATDLGSAGSGGARLGESMRSPNFPKMDRPPISSARLLLHGWAVVNLPVTVLILFFFPALLSWDVPYWFALAGGAAVGWAYWAVAVKYWIRWSYRKGATAARIYSIGKPGLLVWNLEMVERTLDTDHTGPKG